MPAPLKPMQLYELLLKQRQTNLRFLVNMRPGGWSALGRECHLTPQYLLALAGPNPTRQFTERAARQIEDRMDLPCGWLDMQHRISAEMLA